MLSEQQKQNLTPGQVVPGADLSEILELVEELGFRLAYIAKDGKKHTVMPNSSILQTDKSMMND